MSYSQTDKERLAEIRQELIDLTKEALDIVGSSGSLIEHERAKAYWAGHILAACGDEDYISDKHSSLLGLLEDLGYDEYTGDFEDNTDEEEEEENKEE